MNKGYDRLARYYDLIHAELTEDIGFVLNFASRQDGPLLELGCGTGRLLIPLARAGYQVTGIDNSQAMLNLAQKRIASETKQVIERITIQQGDMLDLQIENSFAAAVISYNTAMHLNPTQFSQLLRALRPILKPRAQLLIDVANPFIIEATPADKAVTLERILELPGSKEKVMQFASSWLESPEQQLQICWWFDTIDTTTGKLKRDLVEMVYHYYHLHQLTTMLVDQGYVLVDILGSYSEEPFGEESDRMLLVLGN